MKALEPVQCDYCGYNVAFCTGARCPECGQLLYCRRPMSAEMRRAVLVLSLLVTISAYLHVVAILSDRWPGCWRVWSRYTLSNVQYHLNHLSADGTFHVVRLLVIFALGTTTWTLWRKLGRPGKWSRPLIFLNLLAGLLALILGVVEYHHVRNTWGHGGLVREPELLITQYTPFMIAHGLWLVMWAVIFNRHNKKLDAGRPDIEDGIPSAADSS